MARSPYRMSTLLQNSRFCKSQGDCAFSPGLYSSYFYRAQRTVSIFHDADFWISLLCELIFVVVASQSQMRVQLQLGVSLRRDGLGKSFGGFLSLLLLEPAASFILYFLFL